MFRTLNPDTALPQVYIVLERVHSGGQWKWQTNDEPFDMLHEAQAHVAELQDCEEPPQCKIVVANVVEVIDCHERGDAYRIDESRIQCGILA